MRKTEKQLKEEFRRWRRLAYVPVAGAEDDDPDPADPKDADPADPTDADPKDQDPEDPADPADPKDASDDAVALLTKKVKELEEQKAKAEHAAATAKKEAAQLKTEAAEKTGNYKQLAQEREAQLKDEQENRLKMEDDRDKALAKLDTFEKKVRVVSIAQRLGYRDPEDAISLLEGMERRLTAKGEEQDLMGDDASAERALRKLSEEKKYLVDVKRRTGSPMNGSSGSTMTMEQVKSMTEKEYIARKDEVDKFLATTGGNSG